MSALDDAPTQELVELLHHLSRLLPAGELAAWREVINGRHVVLLRHGERPYVVLPLVISRPPDVPPPPSRQPEQ